MTSSNSKVMANAMQSKTEIFIKKAVKIHGEKYDYSHVVVRTTREKIKIKCRVHGEFEQRIDSHLRGADCPKCGLEKMSKSKSLSRKDFIKRANERHGGKYGYGAIKTEKISRYVDIECMHHGIFTQRYDVHLGGSGCSECSGNKKYTKKTFVEKARLVHGFKYDYRKSIYVNNETKLEIICPDHGSFFQQPNSHFNGCGCPDCYMEVAGGHSRSTYIERCKLNHDGLANLYIIKCSDRHEEFYKVGITSLSLKQRFNKGTLPYDYEVVVFFNDDAGFIWDLEKQLHRVLMNHKHNPKKKFHGRFECFSTVPSEVYRLIDGFKKSSQLQLIA